MKAQIVKMVPIKELKQASFNPPKRLNDIRGLQKSIEEIGLQYPILVNAKNEVIDGHRRMHACELLGWEEVPVLVSASERNRTYAEVNATSKIMSGNDVLFIYFENPDALTTQRRARCDKVCEAIGRNLLRTIMKRGNSLRTYDSGIRAARYCDQVNNKFITAGVRYVLEFGNATLDAAIASGAPASVISNAIKQRVAIKSTYLEATPDGK